jgi:hypothetical protein
MFKGKLFIGFCSAILMLSLVSCMSYYQQNDALMQAVYQQNYSKALDLMGEKSKMATVKRNRLLYYLNKGSVYTLNNQPDSSLLYLRKADYFIEDFSKNSAEYLETMVTNKSYSTYEGEDFEKVLLHYYAAMNYLQLNSLDEALIEAKRMLLKMQKNTDKYQSKNKYKRDAFAHNLLGIIYDAQGAFNDAFIAYRNALEIYESDYKQFFGTSTPLQLKKDILRTAYLSGFKEEYEKYQEEFKLQTTPEKYSTQKQVLVFWNNGLCPIKDNSSINFLIVPQQNGAYQIVNTDLGISVPYYTSDKKTNADLLDMRFIRIVIPKYVSRNLKYSNAWIAGKNNNLFHFEMAENIDAIAFKSLSDRIIKELAESLLRTFLKQLAVYQAEKNKKDGLALAVSLYGAFSEQADTRNWQLLPSQIQYVRVPLDSATNKLTFYAQPIDGKTPTNLTLTISENEPFKFVQTLDFVGYKH